MKKIRNMKIRTKLVTAFSLLVVIALLIGAVGIVGMQMLKVEDKNLYEQNTLPTGILATLNDTLASQRLSAANLAIFYEADPEFAAEEKAYIAEKEADFETLLAEYKATIPEHETEELAQYDMMEERYFGAFAEKKAELYAAFEAKDLAAMQQLVPETDEAGSNVSDVIDDLVEINRTSAGAKIESNQALAASGTLVAIVVIVIGVVISGICVVAINNAIAAPVVRIMAVAKQAGETGDLNFDEATIAGIKVDASYNDEIGQTSLAFASMMDSMIAKAKTLELVAAGDLTPSVERASDHDTLGNAIGTMIDRLNDMFGEVNTATDQVTIGAGQIADGAQALSQGSVEQASAVEELSATIAQVLSQTKDNSQNAEEALEIVNEAGRLMSEATDYMQEMQTAMSGISSSSEEIAKVIKVIDDIAFQTNILALNAAVEAARAGQHGKGFAVVADEVRNLASKSADAAKETAALIQTSVQHVGNGSAIVEKTSVSIEKVGTAAAQTQEKIVIINEASRQQEDAITQINTGIDQVSQVVQTNSATAEESAASSEELSGQSQVLKELVARFTLRNAQPGLPAAAAGAQQKLPPAPPATSAQSGEVIF